jgi:hypothetical protein
LHVSLTGKSDDGLPARTQPLQPVGVGSLDVEIGGILVLVFLVAEEAEPARCALERLLGLCVCVLVSSCLRRMAGLLRTFSSSARGSRAMVLLL